jgi:pyrroline-5-carboxylate reductase
LKPIVFLGAGRITSALVEGLRGAGYRGQLLIHDRNPAKMSALQRKFHARPKTDLRSATQDAGVLVIAVRPLDVGPLLKEIEEVSGTTIGISLAAGIPLKRLRGSLGPSVMWARAMPSPVCRSGQGLTAISFDARMPKRSRRIVHSLFARVGQVLEIPERQFDAFTATYSSSHGYHALSVLAEAAVKLGLNRKAARVAAAHALEGGIRHWREGSETLTSLIQEAATPGGIAATVIQTADRAGYARIVEKALRAGWKRARINARL